MARLLLVLLALALSSSAQLIGQCSKSLATPCGYVDVVLDIAVQKSDFGEANEVYVVKDINFDEWQINAVTAVEQFYDANCLGATCGSLSPGEIHPVECTGGIFDVWVNTYSAIPNLSGETRIDTVAPGGQIAVALYPGDKYVSFSKDGSFLRLGGETSKTVGQLGFRVLAWEGSDARQLSVTFRFHTACEEDVAASNGVYAAYFRGKAYPQALINDLDVQQTRTGSVSVPAIQSLLKREKADSLSVWAAGVIGRDYLSSATLYKVAPNGVRTTIASFSTPDNVWNTATLSPVDVTISSGDFLQWTCVYESTANPPLGPLFPFESQTIPSGDAFADFACDVAFVFTNSRCGGVTLTPSTPVSADCTDPLFSPTDGVPPADVEPLIYDYLALAGACSDGSQWNAHPYICTDQYTGGQCAFCVGRANNMESRTCIDRRGMTCNEMFNTAVRASFCNMEFECPASTISFSLALILAFVVAFLFN